VVEEHLSHENSDYHAGRIESSASGEPYKDSCLVRVAQHPVDEG
jgi:hypothetical protein